MTDIPIARTNVQIEGSQFRSAVSEFLVQSVGAGINFINKRQYTEKRFNINGYYSLVPAPYLSIDQFSAFEFDAEIIDVYMTIKNAGAGGTTELDLRRLTTKGSAGTSIFSTKPAIGAAAGDYTWVHVGDSGAGLTAPVFSAVNANGFYEVNAGDMITMDLVTSQTGLPISTGLIIMYRPR